MKALAVWPQRRDVSVIDVDEPPAPKRRQVRLRALDVGVCGTDLELCSFAFGEAPSGSDYLIAGHEALAEVEEIGPDVEGLRAGDLVVPSVRRPCPHESCPACRSGNQDFCLTGDYTERGIKGAHGFLAEYLTEDERFLHVVPAELRDVGVLTEPLTIAEKGLRQFVGLQRRLPWLEDLDDDALLAGRRAVVLGAGPVGILGCMLLIARGLDAYVYSRAPEPNYAATLIGSIGGTYISSEEVPADRLAARVGRIDLVYEAAGAPRFALDVLRHLGANGTFIFTGVPGHEPPIEIRGDELMKTMVMRNQTVVGTVNANRADFTGAIADLGRFVAAWPDQTRSLIAGRFPLAEFCEQAKSKEGIKRVIAVGGFRERR